MSGRVVNDLAAMPLRESIASVFIEKKKLSADWQRVIHRKQKLPCFRS